MCYCIFLELNSIFFKILRSFSKPTNRKESKQVLLFFEEKIFKHSSFKVHVRSLHSEKHWLPSKKYTEKKVKRRHATPTPPQPPTKQPLLPTKHTFANNHPKKRYSVQPKTKIKSVTDSIVRYLPPNKSKSVNISLKINQINNLVQNLLKRTWTVGSIIIFFYAIEINYRFPT